MTADGAALVAVALLDAVAGMTTTTGALASGALTICALAAGVLASVDINGGGKLWFGCELTALGAGAGGSTAATAPNSVQPMRSCRSLSLSCAIGT